ncbi:MAG: MarR family transcriptional regulator [Pseudomonadota bacterium]|nr:MarR family transcriptional regulator [Pseudomonadota bacterium]
MRKTLDNVNRKGEDDDILELVHAVMHEYRSMQYRFLRDGPHDITHMDAKVLDYFARRPGATQSELALHSGRDKAQLARLVKGLRERGLLGAEADVADRRHLRLHATEAGHEVQRALRQQARHLGARAVTGMSAAERALLASLLQRVKANLASD